MKRKNNANDLNPNIKCVYVSLTFALSNESNTFTIE